MNILTKDSLNLIQNIKNKNNVINFQYKLSKNKYFSKLKLDFIKIYKHYDILIKDIDINQIENIEDNNSNFIGNSIKNKMNYLKYIYEIKHENIVLHFITNKSKNQIKKYMINKIKIICTLKKFFDREKCYQEIVIYDINEKKNLPKKNNDVIKAENCNSGYCHVQYDKKNNGKIVLYRKEELIKVLIHESIHSNFIDYKIIINQNKVNIEGKICSDYNILLNEAFTETFASLINIILVNYYTKIHIDIIFKNELKFMIDTFNKLMNYYEINKMEDIIVKNGCKSYFKQRTNVFSYYILKTINYLFIDEFLELMEKNTNKNYSIKNKAFNKDFISYIFKNIYYLNRFIKKTNIIDRKLRLTLYELNI